MRKPFTEAEITSDVLDLRNEADSVWFSAELCSSGVVERAVNRIWDKAGTSDACSDIMVAAAELLVEAETEVLRLRSEINRVAYL